MSGGLHLQPDVPVVCHGVYTGLVFHLEQELCRTSPASCSAADRSARSEGCKSVLQRLSIHPQVLGLQGSGSDPPPLPLPRLCICMGGSKICRPLTAHGGRESDNTASTFLGCFFTDVLGAAQRSAREALDYSGTGDHDPSRSKIELAGSFRFHYPDSTLRYSRVFHSHGDATGPTATSSRTLFIAETVENVLELERPGMKRFMIRWEAQASVVHRTQFWDRWWLCLEGIRGPPRSFAHRMHFQRPHLRRTHHHAVSAQGDRLGDIPGRAQARPTR